MKIIRLLLKNSWQIFTLGAIASITTGASSAGLIAVINYILQHLEQTTTLIVWSFIGLCLLLMISSASSWILLTRLSQDIIYNLRLELTQKIFACPLRQLEIIGAPKLLATLTEDVNTIANSSVAIANLGVNIALLLGCSVYLFWLSIYIFDEWASDQDPVFKEIFYKKLLPELKAKGKTVIAVSHDDRYFVEADRIIKLDYGLVV